jgi:hypothetical protein
LLDEEFLGEIATVVHSRTQSDDINSWIENTQKVLQKYTTELESNKRKKTEDSESESESPNSKPKKKKPEKIEVKLFG